MIQNGVDKQIYKRIIKTWKEIIRMNTKSYQEKVRRLEKNNIKLKKES